VRSNGKPAGEGEREQRRTNQKPKHGRAGFVELIQSIQKLVYPDYRTVDDWVPPFDHSTVTNWPTGGNSAARRP
jgi:hypothetical protein